MKWRNRHLLVTAFSGWCAVAAHAQLPAAAEFAVLSYPAKGNIHLDEGTLDLWVISDFDTDRKKLSASGEDLRRANLFDLVFPEEQWHYVLSFIPWADAFAMVGYAVPQQRYVWAGPPHWKPGEAHHVVLTWSGRKRSLFCDGQWEWKGGKGPYSSRDVEVEGGFIGDFTNARIEIGRGGFVTIDEVQIRRTALTREEIVNAKDAPLVADVNTLLLDHCDGGPPEIIGGQTGETAGTLSGTYQIVAGKFGKATRLWKAK